MSFSGLLYTFVTAFVALFPVINPIGGSFIVNGLLDDLDPTARKYAVRKILFNSLMIGIGGLLLGHFIVMMFGLEVPVIQIAGGVVICKTAWDMLSDAKTDTDKTHDHIDTSMSGLDRRLFYPIAFPLTIGPGSLAVIFTLMAGVAVKGKFIYSLLGYAMIGLAIVTVLLILYILLLQGPRIMRRLGALGNMVINKLVAFITFCIGIQILINGVAKVFRLTIF